MADRELKVLITGDSSSLHKALGKASKSSSGLSRSLATLGKVGIAGVAAGFVGLGAALKVGFGELADGQKVSAQTAAALKSTGGAANLTARQVETLAEAQSKLTGIDDEAVQAGENMLLTFTKVRNEVGKGNDIFNQATVAIEDMATRMNDGAIPSGEQLSQTAIRIGKALNDPIKGMGALSKVGVQFDESQKKAITSMVKAGDTMGAQKFILAELTKEFGGSAKVAGDTFPGQLNKLKNAFEDAAAGLATALLPFLLQFASWVNQHMPEIQEGFRVAGVIIAGALTKVGKGIEIAVAAFDKLKDPASTIFGAFKDNKDVVITVATAFATMVISVIAVQEAITVATAAMIAFNAVTEANPWVLLATALLAVGAALVVLYLRNEQVRKTVDDLYAHIKSVAIPTLAVLQQAWERFGTALTAIGKVIFGTITLGFRNMFDVLRGIFNVFAGAFTGDWKRMWTGIKQIFDGILGNLIKLALSVVNALLQAGLAIGKAIIDGIRRGVLAAWPGVLAFFTGLPATIMSFGAAMGAAGVALGQQIINGIISGFGGLLGSLKGKLESGLKSVVSNLNPFSSVEEGGVKHIGIPLGEGAIKGWILGTMQLPSKMTETVRAAVAAAAQAVSDSKSVFSAAFDELSSTALAAFDKLAGDFETKTEKKLRQMDEKKAAADRQQALTDAQNALTAAQLAAQKFGPATLNNPQGASPAIARNEGESDEEFLKRQIEARQQYVADRKAANDQLISAQEQFNAANDAITRANLEKKAADERKAKDDADALNRQHFSDALTALQTRLQREGATREEAHQAVVRLMNKYRIPFKNAATALGSALAEGLTDSIKDVDKAATAVRRAILDKLSHLEMVISIAVREEQDARRQHGGPVKRRMPYLVGEAGPELFVPNSAGRVISNNRLTGSAGGGGGAVTNVFNFPHYVGSRSELQQAMQTAVADWGRRNSGQFFAGRA